ncbi:MAG: RNA methyltransferase [Bacteroidota bacterium]
MRKLSMEELGRISAEEFKQQKKLPVMVVLDNIRSMMNIGSVFRTSDAFRLEGICLCGITAIPPNREIHKTALGATESVDWIFYEKTADAIKSLKKLGYEIIAIEQTDSSINLLDFVPQNNTKYAVVFGNEVKGVDDEVLELCDLCVEIPQFGTKHSLNISVTAGIVIWDFFRKLAV